jgi:hypothetical protein
MQQLLRDRQQRRRERIETLFRSQATLTPAWCDRVRDVCVIVSSSRGGSSFFAELLRRNNRLLHFRGEINPFLRLAGLSFPDSGTDSDALSDYHASVRGSLCRLLGADLGQPASRFNGPEDRDRFASDLWLRLSLQWPCLSFAPESVRDWAFATLNEMERFHGWSPDEFPSADSFYIRFLRRVRSRYPDVNPYYYDLPPALVRASFPEVSVPQGPPGPFLLEEPPFLVIGPWKPPTVEQQTRCPLILKTPSNAYRLPFLRRLLPRARFRILHLTRNAAASINGLLDGWRYHGFHSHRLPARLKIAGYSDSFPKWGRHWWKFDLPPDWQEWTERPLVEVCAFQWLSAHRAILEETQSAVKSDTFRLPFEALIGDAGRREASLTRLAAWWDVPADSLTRAAAAGLQPIMATSTPRKLRWMDKSLELAPALKNPCIGIMMKELGYDIDISQWL